MLSQPIFDDRALSESFYQALINRFHDSLNLATQTVLGECSYGLAPSPSGVKTFFVIAPSLLVAEQLIQDIELIIERVETLMAGVGQVAVCVSPSQEGLNCASRNPQQLNSNNHRPTSLACKIFQVSASA